MRGRRSERKTRGRECGTTRGQDGSVTRGNTTTNLRNEMMRGRCNERMMRGEAGRRDGGMTRGREGSATTDDSTTSWHNKRTRGQRDQTMSVLKFIIPLILLHKLSEWLSFDSEPIQSWRSDDQSTVTIFLHLNFLGELWCRMPIQLKWPFNLCFGDTPLMQALTCPCSWLS